MTPGLEWAHMSDPLRLATGAFRYEPPRTGGALDAEGYRGPTWWPLTRLREFGANPGMRRILFLWLLVNATAVLTGVLNVALGWNGIELRLGAFRFDVTIFPPLVLSLLCAIWLGPTWGIVPAYLGNLASALWSGIAWPTSVLFALAGAIETFIFWGSLVTLNIAPGLRRGRDLLRLLAVAVIAPVTSSLAVVIWNSALGLDFLTGQRIWRGWVIGDFLQTVLVVAPLLRFLGAPVRSWVDRQLASSPRSEVTYTRTALLAFLVFTLMGVLVFAGIGMLQGSLDVDPEMRTQSGELFRPRLFEIQFFLGLLVAALILATGVFSTVLARMSERQRGLTRRESLTGCFNRRAFYELFPRESDRSRRLGQGIAVVFLDVDHFKTINDRLGHEVGDRVLQQLALRVQGVIRETDLLFRWGGEEFVILLSHTVPDDAFSLAERVRAAIADRPFLPSEITPPVTVTASLGTSGTTTYPVAPDDLLTHADAACYKAKEQGRNRVVVGEPGPADVPTAPAAAAG
jgi:diguanylate cyclase (GGDEF)-like protein